MLNRVTLIGRLTRDPELRYTQSGAAIARFTLAVDRGRKNAQGEKETDFIRCSCWNKQAELVSNWLGKGRLAAVEGSLRISDVDQDGQRKQYVEVVCNAIYFLDKAKDQAAADGNEFMNFGEEVDLRDDDVPF